MEYGELAAGRAKRCDLLLALAEALGPAGPIRPLPILTPPPAANASSATSS